MILLAADADKNGSTHLASRVELTHASLSELNPRTKCFAPLSHFPVPVLRGARAAKSVSPTADFHANFFPFAQIRSFTETLRPSQYCLPRLGARVSQGSGGYFAYRCTERALREILGCRGYWRFL
jgi:hypothetical protein